MLPLFSTSYFTAVVTFDHREGRITSRVIESQQTPTGLRHVGYAFERREGIEGFGVAGTMNEACRRANR